MSPSKKGILAEYLFAAAAAAQGYALAWPDADSSYDVLVVDEVSGKTTKVQIKACFRHGHSESFALLKNGFRADNRRKRRYTQIECDIIAVYYAPTTAWYFVPTLACPGQVRFTKTRCPALKRFLENWKLFERKKK